MRGLRAWLAAHRRLLWIAVGVGLVLVAWAHPPAGASAGDVFQSTGPPTQVGTETLINRWPLSHYALDLHIDKIDISSAPDIPDVPKLILYGLTDLIWQITAFLTWLVIQLFTFAFSLDLLQGSEATGGQGALEPVSQAVDNLYGSTIGEPWLVLAIVAVGLWGVKTALAQRRISETISAFTTSLVFAVIALWFVTNPAGSVGFIADKSNEVSAAFLSVSSSGEVVGQERARNDATDQLFKAHIYDPWLVLNFGGTRHCVTSESLDRAKEAKPEDIDDTLVGINAYGPPPNNSQGDPVSRECYDSRRYAGSYLHYNVDDEDRKGAEDESSYAAINEGDPKKWPEGLPDSYKVDLDAGDAAAVSMQESSGVTQRLGTAVVIFLANLGVIILLGALSIAVILAQILALLLLLFAPIALVIGIFPGRGHDFFRKWLIKLLTALFRKAIYSFVIAVLLAAAAALTAASANLGWLMAFGLQATFYWMVFLYRKQIVAAMTAATTGGEADDGGGSKAAQVYYKSKMAMGVGKGAAGATAAAPGVVATAAAGAARGVRDTGRDTKHQVSSVRDWVQRKRTGPDTEDTPRADDRDETTGNDAGTGTGTGGEGRNGHETPTVTPVPTGGGSRRPPGGEEDPDQNGRSNGHPTPTPRPPRQGAGAGAGAPGAHPPGEDPDMADGGGHDGRDGRPGTPGATGSTGPPAPGTSGTPPAGPSRGGDTPPSGDTPGGRPPERGGAQPPTTPSRQPPKPAEPAPPPTAPAGGSQQQPPAKRDAGGARRADAAIRDVDKRIRELQTKRGRSAGEKHELDRLRDWRRKAGD